MSEDLKGTLKVLSSSETCSLLPNKVDGNVKERGNLHKQNSSIHHILTTIMFIKKLSLVIQ